MVIQEKDYLKKRKRSYLKASGCWVALMGAIFITGLVVTKSRNSYFTVFSGVIAIGAALNLTKLIGILKYKDGSKEYAEYLEEMKGNYNIFHSSLIPNAQGIIYFEHIVVTSKRIYFITYQETCMKKNRLEIENRMMAKGIESKNIQVIWIKDKMAMKELVRHIEKDETYESNKKDEYTTIINGMLM